MMPRWFHRLKLPELPFLGQVSAAVLVCIGGANSGFTREPAMAVVNGGSAGVELLSNGDFEQEQVGTAVGWTPGPRGFRLVPGAGRGSSRAVVCDSTNRAEWCGASQTVVVNQTNPQPLLVRGWSKALNVSGSLDSDYSLYVDLVYSDGTPLWGQTANFRTGTHPWEERELMIIPQKPVRSLTLHCLFRNHSGRVWFDDVSVKEVVAPAGAVMFQGAPVVCTQRPTGSGQGRAEAGTMVAATEDGLSLEMRDDVVTALRVGDRNLAGEAPSGFLVRDVARNSGFYSFEGGACPELGLRLKAEFSGGRDHISVKGRVSDILGKDRAVTLVFALPIDATGWMWGDDIRQARLIGGAGEFSRLVSIKCGATGGMSLYPMAAISGPTEGLALAIDMGEPAQYRLGYQAGTKQLFLAFDFGLVPESEHFPSSADFRFVLYRFQPRWGFRAAFQKLMTIYPEYFVVRSHEQGLWMPFTDISTVQGWKDFGFRYHEGNNNVAWDTAHGVLSFRYTEPMTWWMSMPPEVPRTLAGALHVRDQLAEGPPRSGKEMAEVTQVAAMWDEAGEPCLLFRNEPWCNGAVWSLNPNPRLPAGADPKGSTPRWNAATVHWNPALRAELYGGGAKGKLGGEYLDSLEGYVTSDLNFRRDHFRYTSVPLTFETETCKPALFKGLAVFEFAHWFCQEVHDLGKLTFANGVPYRFTFLCPWLDILGTETDWLQNGRYHPASDEQMSLWRTMAGGKPYLLLMNTDFDAFNSELVERYFQRSLFYGMFPGMFSHNAADNPYWANPKWYNRDRSLFKKYLPLVKRVAEAGWRPVTRAVCSNQGISMERFGPEKTGAVLFTLFNDTDAQQRGRVQVDLAGLALTHAATAREVLSGRRLEQAADWQVQLGPQEVKLVELAK